MVEVLDTNGRLTRCCLALLIAVAGLAATTPVAAAAPNPTRIDPALLALAKANPTTAFSVIVRAAGTSSRDRRALRASKAIERSKGRVGHGLSIIGGASATLSGAQLIVLSHDTDVAYISADQILSAKFDPALGATRVTTPGIREIGAARVWQELGVTGRGVGVAIVDSGIADSPDLAGRIVASVDFTSGAPGEPLVAAADPGGHGTHVAGLVAGDGTASAGAYTGVAPGADLVDVRVIGATGATNVSTVLRGLQWVLAQRATYNIRVVNMSLGATTAVSYRQDPLATAVEVLTFAGVTVVVAAGNAGPGDSTITTPGDDPYAITVGALDDSGTAASADDVLAPWSSRGPTSVDGIAKPDLVAPGRKMISLRSPGSTLDLLYPERRIAGTDPSAPAYFRMSGTSMAAPVVTGIVALMLERDPALTPRQVKQALLDTASPLAFGSPTTTGAGMADAYAAVLATDRVSDAIPYRVSDGFAWDALPYVQGQPLVWRDPGFNGGVDSNGTPWSSVTWDSIVWDAVTWEAIAWGSFNWTEIAWEDIAWEDIAWESTTPSMTSLSSAGSGWKLVN